MRLILVLVAVFGLSYAAPKVAQPRALMDDLNEFIALIPWADITTLHDANLQTNDELIQVVVYLQSPEFHGVIDYVATHPTYIELKTWITAQGVDVDSIVNGFHTWIEGLVPGAGGGPETLRSYLDSVYAIVPWLDLFNLLNDKLTNSVEFQDLYTHLAAETTHQLVEDVRALPEVQRVVAVLEGMGLQVQQVLTIVYAFFGWGAPRAQPRALMDDLNEFIALIPWADITTLHDANLQTNDELIQVVVYLQSPEFHGVIDYVATHPTYIELKTWITAQGVDVDSIVNGFHTWIEGLVPGAGGGPETLRSYLDSVYAIVPWLDLFNLLNDKLTNSVEFQDLYTHLAAETTHQLVEDVRALPEVQRVVAVLEGMGLQVQQVLTIVYAFFGWGAPRAHTRTLQDDLDAFLALIPWAEINAINEIHLQSNSEVIDIVLYWQQSPDWAGVVDYVATHPTWIELKAWILTQGIDVDVIIAGIKAWVDGLVTGPGGGPETLRSYLDEVEAIIPWVDLLLLLDDKMTNSPDFQAFYTQISSETSHLFVEDVRALPEVQRLATVLTDMGVKVQEVLALVYAWLGWGAPRVGFRLS